MGYCLKIKHVFIATVIFFFVYPTYTKGQRDIKIINNDTTAIIDFTEISNILYKSEISEKDSIISLVINGLTSKGYFKAIVDSVITDDIETFIFIHSGTQHFFRVNEHNLTKAFLLNYYHKEIESGKAFNYSYLNILEKQVISYYENIGYPLASLKKQNIEFINDTIEFDWKLNKGDFFVLEEVNIGGNLYLSPNFIRGISRLRPKMPYSESRISRAGRKFSELEFARLVSEPEVILIPAGAKVNFPLEKIRANRFDGIAGLMSEPGQDNNNNYKISGQMQLYLVNSLGYGEYIDMQWRAPGEGSQQLNIKSAFPYILGTPVEIGYEFFMNKQDTTFLMLRQKPVVSFRGYGILNFSTFVIIETNNVLLQDFNSHHSQFLSDYKKTLYGAEIKLKSGKTGHTFNKGWKIRTSLAAGNRSINNTSRPDILQEKSMQYLSENNIKYHLPFMEHSLLALSLDVSLQTGDKFLNNELFRIGGFNSLKGFDENSLVCSSYGIFTTEYRFYMAKETYLGLLANFAWIENNSVNYYNKGFPWGVAAGVNVKTQPGILSVYYGLGKPPNQEFQFRNAKIHVGFISIF